MKRQPMLGTSYYDGGMVRHYTHWYTLWVGHNSTSERIQDDLQPKYILTTTFLTFTQISAKNPSTGTPTAVTTSANNYGSQDPCMLPVYSLFFYQLQTSMVGYFPMQ